MKFAFLKHLVVSSIISLALILAAILRVPSFFVESETVACQDLPLRFEPQSGVTCYARSLLGSRYSSVIINAKGEKQEHQFSFLKSDKFDHFRLYGQSVESANIVSIVDAQSQQVLARSFSSGSTWSAMTRSEFGLKLQDENTYHVIQSGNFGPYELLISPTESREFIESSKSQAVLHASESQSYFLIKLLSAILWFSAFLILLRHSKSKIAPWFFLVSTFAVLTLYCGLPFGSSVGWYDSGDDKSYVQWTYHLGFIFDPFLSHSDFKSWSQISNHHVWGTGLLLAPFVAPGALLAKKMTMGAYFYGLMSNGVIMLSFMAVGVYYLAFRRISTIQMAAIASLGTLVCTSLLKWTYMRNFFSHVPEAFAIAVATYGFIGRHLTKEHNRFDFAILLLGFFMACQVRRENLAFAPLLLWFEVVGERGFSFSSILNQARRNIWSIAFIVLVALFSEFVLHLTNYLTEVNSFFGHVAAAPYLHVGKMFEMFHRNGMNVLFGQAFGLFYWKNLFAILPALLVIVYRRSFRIWFPMVCTVMLYCTLCIMYEWPNGMDWQNRFFLKLNPIFFTALVYQLGRSSGILRWISLSAVLISAFFELGLYMDQLPYGMSFYIHQFSDQTFLYPASSSNWNTLIFYLPLIILFVGALLAIAALAFNEYRAVSRSRGLSVGVKQ